MFYSLALSVFASSAVSFAVDSSITQKTVNLNEVSVLATKHKVDDLGGKIVYNAYLEKVRTDVTTADLLRKVPMVAVDMYGNVSIRGNDRVKVLVNGHSLGILSTGQILEQISPADIIKVEVMTTPGVRYESQGTGGILNIITQKRIYFKSSGYLNIGAGTKGSHLMGNFNYILSRLWSLQNSFYSLVGYSSNTGSNNYSGNTDGNNVGQLYSYMGGVSRCNDKSQLNLGLQYLYQGTTYEETRQDGGWQKMNSGYHYISTVADYNLTIDDKTKMDFQTRFYFLPTHSTMHRESVPCYKSGSNIFGQMSQVDFTFRPLQILYINAGVSNNYSHFHDRCHDQVINSIDNFGAYTELKFAIAPILSLMGGLRYEFYNIDAQLNRKKNYHDLFYNLGVDYKVTPFSTASLTFSRRTDRPTYATLLLDANYQGGDVIQQGNSNIEPCYSYLLEGGWSLYVGDNFFKFSPYYRYENAPISLFMRIEDGMMRQSSINLECSHSWGMELWSTMSLLKGKLNFNGGLDVMHTCLETNNKSNSGWQLQYTMNVTWQLLPSLYVNCYGTWQNRRIFIQGCQSSYLYSNISIQKSWHDDHYRLALSVDNPFRNGVMVKRNYDIDNTSYFSQTKYHNTGIRVFFIYKFGKRDMEKNMKIKQNILNNN